jgi:signal transduction histidine kinase
VFGTEYGTEFGGKYASAAKATKKGQKVAATALRRSESILQQMFHATPMGFLLVDNRNDAILHFNLRFCEIWGIAHLADAMRRGELKNGDIIPHCLPVLEDVPAFAASCEGLQLEGNRAIIEDKIPFKGGRFIRRYSTQIRDVNDDYYGRFYIFEDITNQKRLEHEIAANLEKERQVSEIKTRFISITSHEFRTPMAAAMGSVDLLANHFDRMGAAKRQELLGRITVSMHRMTEMLDEVLLLNRMDANRIPVKSETIHLRQQLQSFIDEIRLGDTDSHAFEFEVQGDLKEFVTDLSLFHHIVSNLLSNAVRYSPPKSTIKITASGSEQAVTLVVADQGIGIREADQARIFEPFERGANVGNIKGTGLGLSIVKRMTELLGGTISVSPASPKGSRFELVLPRGKLNLT